MNVFTSREAAEETIAAITDPRYQLSLYVEECPLEEDALSLVKMWAITEGHPILGSRERSGYSSREITTFPGMERWSTARAERNYKLIIGRDEKHAEELLAELPGK